MEKIPEFIANHLFLFSLLASITMLLLWNFFGDIRSMVKQITPAEMVHFMNNDGAMIYDIRNQSDYEQGYILNAKNVPIDSLPNEIDIMKKSATQNPVILYCNDGMKSKKESKLLISADINQLYVLKGGLHAWRNANLPTIKGQSAAKIV